MAAVDQHEQLNGRRPAEIHQRVEGGADGTAREEDIVHQDENLATDVKQYVSALQLRLVESPPEVIPVESNIETTHKNLLSFNLFDLFGDAVCKIVAAGSDSDHNNTFGAGVLFDNLMSKPIHRSSEPFCINDDFTILHGPSKMKKPPVRTGKEAIRSSGVSE